MQGRTQAAGVTRRGLLAAACGLAAAGAAPVAARPFELAAEGGRTVRVWHWRARGRRRGRIAFSHGALSAPWKYTALIEPWAAAGFEVFAPLHVDSTDHPATARYPGLASWAARLDDMAVLSRHIGVPHIAAGHSYGGLVALVLGGATAVSAGATRDARVRAAVAFSPPGPMPGLIDAAGYATLGVPAFVQTGDADLPPGSTGGDAWRSHLAAYDAAAPGGDRYALVLAGADHYFGNLICRPERAVPPQTAQLQAASRLSGLFLRGFGDGEPAARRELDAQLAVTGPVLLARK